MESQHCERRSKAGIVYSDDFVLFGWCLCVCVCIVDAISPNKQLVGSPLKKRKKFQYFPISLSVYPYDT